MMGAFILAGAVLIAGFAIAVFAELARGMATAPSMHDSYFIPICLTSLAAAVVIAATHWLPHMGW